MSSTPHQYCSHNSRDVSHENPIGSAPKFDRAFFLEIPLPWSRIPLETPHIPSEISRAIAAFQEANGKLSVYLLAPDSSYQAEGSRLIDVQVVDGTIVKRDIIAANGDIASVIAALAADAPLPATATIDPTPWRDIAVCTHGSRDACCASFGAPTYLKMHAAARNLPNTRVWRCSHLGGHRFAPTMIDLPSGRSWGLVDDNAARGILFGEAAPADLMPHYRGWAGIGSPELQMLEAHLLERVGWKWSEYARQGEILENDEQGRGVRVRLTGTHPHRDSITCEADIHWGDEFTTIASCNAEPVAYVRKHLANIRDLVLAN